MGKRVTVRDRSWLKLVGDVYWVDITRKGYGRLKRKIVDPINPRPNIPKSRAIELGDEIVRRWLETAGRAGRQTRLRFSEAARQMMAAAANVNRQSTMDRMRATFESSLNVSFGAMFLEDIQETHWTRHVTRRRQLRPGCDIGHDVKYFGKLRRWAIRNEYRMADFPIKELNPRPSPGRVIPPEDYSKLLAAANEDMAMFLRMAWECGMRRSEILKLSWDRVDLNRGTIVLDAHHTKTRKGRLVPLPQSVLDALQKRSKESRWVFPHRKGPDRPRVTVQKTWERLQAKVGIEKRYRIHDCRHSFMTRSLVEKNLNLSLVCRYAGMSPQVATARYLHTQLNELRRVVN